MSWTPLSHRLACLPLILAGPILRRTEPDAVTVWVALRKPAQVTLSVYATNAGSDVIVNDLILEGCRSTVPLGKYLHVVAVTAKPVSRHRLEPGQIYAYNLNFAGYDGGLINALNSENFFPNVTVSYFEHQLPTFALPPDDLNHLRIVHGSCRKPHGGGRDALPILDDAIALHATLPNSRPHQLFFTGDQIYGDDVADPLLWAVTDAGEALLGWAEDLPLGDEYKKPRDLRPGERSDIARDYGGFTAMLVNQPEKAKSHLFSLGEYYAMYLFAWSQVLWPTSFPLGQEIRKNRKQAKLWNEEAHALEGFARELWKVRRVLANVPIYTICDDHDISDDWYLNREWCNRVLGKPLGRRTVQNGLLAYAVFQAWGNTPDQFMAGQSGEKLLQAAQNWSASGGQDKFASEEISKYVGIPPLDAKTGLPKLKLDGEVLILDGDNSDGTSALHWHYTVRSFKHEVIVLDTRTWRGYPQGQDKVMEPPMLLCPTAFYQQIQQPLERSPSPPIPAISSALGATSLTTQTPLRPRDKGKYQDSGIEATLVIVPTNLVSLSIIDVVQRLHLSQGKVFGSDVGDSWNFHEEAFTTLLAQLFKRRDRIVILSGDIHYSCAVRLNYWSRRHFGDTKLDPNAPEKPKVLAQLTASAFKNEEWKTNVVHTKIKSIFPEPSQDWVGWNEPPQLVEIQTTPEKVRILEVELPDQKPTIRQLNRRRGNEEIVWQIAVKNQQSLPDWRYRIDWIKREQAQEIDTHLNPILMDKRRVRSTASDRKGMKELITSLWRNQWLQEGDEVLGHNNFGIISFNWVPNDEAKAVIQDVYWRPLWQPNSIVFSRYCVPLRLDAPPPSPKVISP
jgi:hypothetical protein